MNHSIVAKIYKADTFDTFVDRLACILKTNKAMRTVFVERNLTADGANKESA